MQSDTRRDTVMLLFKPGVGKGEGVGGKTTNHGKEARGKALLQKTREKCGTGKIVF